MRSGYWKVDGFLGSAGLLLFAVSIPLIFRLPALGRKAYSALRSAMGAPAKVDLEI